MTLTNYSKAIPPEVLPKLKRFITAFYLQSDTPPPHPPTPDPYLKAFVENATLIMGTNEVKNHSGIAALRQTMWLKVTKRHHIVYNVSYLSDSEYIINGCVNYVLINGKNMKMDWSAIIYFENIENDDFKMKRYQVYLDSGVIASALN